MISNFDFDSEAYLYFEHLGLFLTSTGCLLHDKTRSYNGVIKEKLKERYGRDMLITFKKDMRVFYDSLNRLKTRKAIFRRGEKHVLDWFKSMADFYQYDKKNRDLGNNLKITLTFTVNRKGKCKNFNLPKTESLEFNKHVLSTLKKFFKYNKWLPAKQDGTRIEEEKAYDIVFNPD